MLVDMRELHDQRELFGRDVKALGHRRQVMRFHVKECEHAFVRKKAAAVDPEPEMNLDLFPEHLLGKKDVVARDLRIF